VMHAGLLNLTNGYDRSEQLTDTNPGRSYGLPDDLVWIDDEDTDARYADDQALGLERNHRVADDDRRHIVLGAELRCRRQLRARRQLPGLNLLADVGGKADPLGVRWHGGTPWSALPFDHLGTYDRK
jgi:hypothetical protein